MSDKKTFLREIKHLRTRGNAAYRDKNDELLIKLVNCLVKTAETQAKLTQGDDGRVEIVLHGDITQGEEASLPEGDGP